MVTATGQRRALHVVSRPRRREEGGCEGDSDCDDLVGRRPGREEDAVKTADLDAGEGGEGAGAEEEGEDRYTVG
jgi:hypothetical protein